MDSDIMVSKYTYTRLPRLLERIIFTKVKGRCQLCGTKTSFDRGEFHHLSKNKKKRYDPDNIIWVCNRDHRVIRQNRNEDQVRKLVTEQANIKTPVKAKNDKKQPNISSDIVKKIDKCYNIKNRDGQKRCVMKAVNNIN